MIFHTTLSMSIGIIMFLEITDNQKWIGLVLTVLCFIVFVEVMVLAVFHCYISFCLYKTTLQVLRGDKDSSNGVSSKNPNAIHPMDVKD